MAEPLPMRMARRRTDELRLANVLIAPFRPFQGAPHEVLEEEELEGRKGMGKACNALELAIVTEAKSFISVSVELVPPQGTAAETAVCILPEDHRCVTGIVVKEDLAERSRFSILWEDILYSSAIL